ncbi:MAG: NDP-sugar synthase [Candidatus Bathyarchaeota archaeon]|nr:NDP-sugar synthase [Candidatus Bathyarchaeota archaeon]
MKALVLAGGFGTRLRPLSCTRPKMLFPVANQPLLDWTLRNLSDGGVDTVILAVNYMAEALVRYSALRSSTSESSTAGRRGPSAPEAPSRARGELACFEEAPLIQRILSPAVEPHRRYAPLDAQG